MPRMKRTDLCIALFGTVLLTLGCHPDRLPGADGTDDGGSGLPDAAVGPPTDSVECLKAADSRSYIGCDYWPTVLANPVWSIFDFTVAVANAGFQPANVTVTGPNGYTSTAMVLPSELTKIYLPWVPELKGGDFNDCVIGPLLSSSVVRAGGAYHLHSSQPVTVYQFSALQYRGAGGQAGKDWSSCPGIKGCGGSYGCYSFSNDASLLLPSTALTGNYRVTSLPSEGAGGFSHDEGMAAYFGITAVHDQTQVTVKVGSKGTIKAGGVISAVPSGGAMTLTMNAGDVAQLVCDGYAGSDLSGSLVSADKAVQVIAGAPCMHNPTTTNACDHLEQSVFPAETLGKHYVVTVPTGPRGQPVGHTVRLYGNVDGTTLSFDPPVPNAPTQLAAGQVADLGVVSADFEVKGSHEFSVGTFMLGGGLVDPMTPQGMQEGDPSQSQAVAVEQYRSKYVFLAPDDYDTSWLDAVLPPATDLMLDGQPVNVAGVTVGGSGYVVKRIALDKHGTHVLSATNPIGIQVSGYGVYTSYQYPGGLDLNQIASPPG